MSVFWFFMLGVTVLCPLTMVVLGNRFVNVPPERINSFYGYRTARSMKNPDTWIFAHHCCGRYWQRIGRWVLVLSVLSMVCVFGRDMNTVSAVGTVLVFLQMIPLLLAFPLTERALKRSFDSSGRKIVKK